MAEIFASLTCATNMQTSWPNKPLDTLLLAIHRRNAAIQKLVYDERLCALSTGGRQYFQNISDRLASLEKARQCPTTAVLRGAKLQ